MKRSRLLIAAALPAALAFADDPPAIEHQPIPCTIPGKPIAVCAEVTDDAMVAKAKVFFRATDEKYYSWAEMQFGGLNYCATLPAPREGKLKSLDYYVQATDDQFQSQRTSTYVMLVQPEGVCEFPPIEKNPERASSIKVYASSPKQGKKLPDDFDATGVTWVPLGGG
jgi:hypothetical protein